VTVVPQAVVFDVNGTLFDLRSVREAFAAIGAPPSGFEAFFQRILHEAATVTLVDAYRPFTELAAAALRTTLAQLGVEPGREEPLQALAELDAYPEAEQALQRAREAGLSVIALTNGGVESTEQLLDRAGLRGLVEHVLSCDQVEAFKPHRAPYELALRKAGGAATMVAAHGWDVVGARAAGLEVVWIDREEREWPFPLPEPPRAHDLVEAVELVVALPLSSDR
jgi:2-haloacid dehalogenase